MSKKPFALVGALVAMVGGMALTACNSCGPCTPVYKKPCCAQSGGSTYAAPAPAPMAPAPKPAGGQMSCGAGKCG